MNLLLLKFCSNEHSLLSVVLNLVHQSHFFATRWELLAPWILLTYNAFVVTTNVLWSLLSTYTKVYKYQSYSL